MVEVGNLAEDVWLAEAYFPTIIFNIETNGTEELNAHLLDLTYAERERDAEGVERSNVRALGAWHSKLLLHHEEPYRPLVDRIYAAGARISKRMGYDKRKQLKIGTMWSNINAPGSFNTSHIHPGAHWSGVYYLKMPEDGGDISFKDPRTEHMMNAPAQDADVDPIQATWTSVSYTPEPGQMLIFPSWLYHSVDVNMSKLTGDDADRVVIAFNLIQEWV